MKKNRRCLGGGGSPSKLIASHLCGCTGKEGVNEGGDARGGMVVAVM